MSEAWVIAASMLRQHLRDPAALVLTFVVPVVMFLIFAAIFGGNSSDAGRLDVAMADESATTQSAALLRAFAREDAVRRQQDLLGDGDVGRPEAQFPCPGITASDHSPDLMGTTQHAVRGAQVARTEGRPDGRGGHRPVGSRGEQPHPVDREAQRLAHLGQQSGIATALMPEVEVLAHDDDPGVGRADQGLVHEVLGGLL